MTSIIGPIAAAVMIGSIQTQKKAQNKKLKKQREETLRMERQRVNERFFEILPLQTAAFNICRDWTGSKCEEEKDFIRMAELYAKEQAIERGIILPKLWSWSKRKPVEELKELNEYRRAFSDFYTQTVNYQNLPSILHLCDFKKFSTFHWTLAMTNNVMKPDITRHYQNLLSQNTLYHQLALEEIFRRSLSDGKRIEEMQACIRPHFHKIRAQLGLPCPSRDP